jgi:hypothetical protein
LQALMASMLSNIIAIKVSKITFFIDSSISNTPPGASLRFCFFLLFGLVF